MGIPKTLVSLEENPDIDDPFHNRRNAIEGHITENGNDGLNLFDWFMGFQEPVPTDDDAPLSALFVRSAGFSSFSGFSSLSGYGFYNGYSASRSSRETMFGYGLYLVAGEFQRPAALRYVSSVRREVVFGFGEGNEHDDDVKHCFLSILKGYLQEKVRAQKTESVKKGGLRSSCARCARKNYEFQASKHQLPLLLQNASHSGSKKLSRYHPSHFWQVLE